jgi:hypothetical protein
VKGRKDERKDGMTDGRTDGRKEERKKGREGGREKTNLFNALRGGKDVLHVPTLFGVLLLQALTRVAYKEGRAGW